MMKLEDVKAMIKRTDLKLDEVKEIMKISEMKDFVARRFSLEMESKTIFDQLKKEHDELKRVLLRGRHAESHERALILKQICDELVPHARAEEKTLYALMRQKAIVEDADAFATINEGYEEHHVADELISELKSLDVESERWPALFKVIKDNLENHIKQEEDLIWSMGMEMFNATEQKNLLTVYFLVKAKYSETLPDQTAIRERDPAPEAEAVI